MPKTAPGGSLGPGPHHEVAGGFGPWLGGGGILLRQRWSAGLWLVLRISRSVVDNPQVQGITVAQFGKYLSVERTRS
jgi:hypothetical protein